MHGNQRHMHADAQNYSAHSWNRPLDMPDMHACFLTHKSSQPSENRRPACWQWRRTFPLPWLPLPEPPIQRFPCQRRRYITAATDPAVQITNAAHGGGDHVLQPGSIQAPAAIAGAQLLQWPGLSVCWEGRSHVPLPLLSSHVQRSPSWTHACCPLLVWKSSNVKKLKNKKRPVQTSSNHFTWF